MIWPVVLFDIKEPTYFPKKIKLFGWSKEFEIIGEDQFLQVKKDFYTFPFLYNSNSDTKAFEFLKKFSDKIHDVISTEFYNYIFTSDEQEWYHHFCPIVSNNTEFKKLVEEECEILNELVIDTEQSRKFQFIFC